MKWVSYTWSLFRNLVALVVALTLLGHFDGDFEQAVMGGLVIIYAHVKMLMFGNAMVWSQTAKTDLNRFLILLKAVGSDRFQDEDSEQHRRDEEEAMHRGMVKAWMDGITAWIMFVAGLLTILGVLS